MTEVLDELAENLKWQDEIAGQAKKAMVYPTIVMVVIVMVMIARIMAVGVIMPIMVVMVAHECLRLSRRPRGLSGAH